MNDPLRKSIRAIVVVPMAAVGLIFGGCLATLTLKSLVSHAMHREFWERLANFVVDLILVIPLAIPGLLFLAFWGWLCSDGAAKSRHRRGRQFESLTEIRKRLGNQLGAATDNVTRRSVSNSLSRDQWRA